MILAGKILLKKGAKNILIKGGHNKSSSRGQLVSRDKVIIFKNKRIKTKNTMK